MNDEAESKDRQDSDSAIRQNALSTMPLAEGRAKFSSRHKKLLNWVPIAIAIVGALLVIPEFLQKWYWMRQLDYDGIFWTLFSIKLGLIGVAFTGAFLFFWLNLRQAAKKVVALEERETVAAAGAVETRVFTVRGIAIPCSIAKQNTALVAAVIGAFFAFGFYTHWDTYLRFRYGGSLEIADPIFGKDVGFYLFRLPFYQLLKSSLVILTLLTIAGVLYEFAFFEIGRLRQMRQSGIWRNACADLSLLLVVLAAAFGWGYYLDRYALMYSTRGVVYGVGYTADHVTIIAQWIMIGASAVACPLLVLNSFRPRSNALALGAVLCSAQPFGHLHRAGSRSKIRGPTKRTQVGSRRIWRTTLNSLAMLTTWMSSKKSPTRRWRT